MKKNSFLSLFIGILLFLPSCTRLSYDIVPHKTATYHSLALKVNVKNQDSGQRDNFKILLKYDDSMDKMFFLSPLNQVYGLLLLESEHALLIATKKKKYWKGTFNDLVQEICGLDFDYREFKRLVVDGVLPEDKIKEQGLNISFEEGLPGEAPQRLKIEKGALSIKLKISDRKTGKGIISFSRGLKGMKEAGIRELLEEEG